MSRLATFLALCMIGCAGPPQVLAGNWKCGGVDFTIRMDLQGTPDNLHGTAIYSLSAAMRKSRSPGRRSA